MSLLHYYETCLYATIMYMEKNPKRGVEDMEFPGGIEETASGNSRGQLKKNLNDQGVMNELGGDQEKIIWNSGVLVFYVGISKVCNTLLWNLHG